jgi:RNA polymerase sigma-70 factor (ECF subfamily)
MSLPSSSRDWLQRSRPLSQPLARTGLGERDAFAALYAKSSAHLYAVALRLCGDGAVAAAVLEDVYVHAWHASARFDTAHADPLTWLTHLVRQRALERMHPGHGGAARLHADDAASAPAAALPPALVPGLDALATWERAAFALAFLEGLDAAALAQRLGQPPAAVRRAVRRALQAIASEPVGATRAAPAPVTTAVR